MKQLCLYILLGSAAFTGCKKGSGPIPDPLKTFTVYASFDLRISWVGSYNNSTKQFELDPNAVGFISCANQTTYKFKGGEATNYVHVIDFIYTVSGTGRTGYFSNPGYFKEQYGTATLGWNEWNEKSVIAAAHSFIKDPGTGTALALSNEQFDAINSVESLFSTVNFGDNASVPLQDANKPGGIAAFNIYQDGTVDGTYYFIFIDAGGRHGVFRISKGADASSITVKVKLNT